MLCLARFSQDGVLYRARVTSLCPQSQLLMAQYFDYGNMEEVDLSSLYLYPDCLIEVAPGAEEIVLANPPDCTGENRRGLLEELLLDVEGLVLVLETGETGMIVGRFFFNDAEITFCESSDVQEKERAVNQGNCGAKSSPCGLGKTEYPGHLGGFLYLRLDNCRKFFQESKSGIQKMSPTIKRKLQEMDLLSSKLRGGDSMLKTLEDIYSTFKNYVSEHILSISNEKECGLCETNSEQCYDHYSSDLHLKEVRKRYLYPAYKTMVIEALCSCRIVNPCIEDITFYIGNRYKVCEKYKQKVIDSVNKMVKEDLLIVTVKQDSTLVEDYESLIEESPFLLDCIGKKRVKKVTFLDEVDELKFNYVCSHSDCEFFTNMKFILEEHMNCFECPSCNPTEHFCSIKELANHIRLCQIETVVNPEDHFKVGDIVFAKWGSDSIWYRGVIYRELPFLDYEVLFADYGNIDYVGPESVVRSLSQISVGEIYDYYSYLY